MAKGTDKNRKHFHKPLSQTKAGKKSNPQPTPKVIESVKVTPTINNISSILSQFHAIGVVLEAGYRDEVIIKAKVAPGTEKAATKKLSNSVAGKIRLITD